MLKKIGNGSYIFAAVAAFSLIGEPDISFAKNNGNNGKSENSSGNGGGNANGKGNSKEEGHPSELKKLNGVINANENALANANENSVHGIARTYRDSVRAVDSLTTQSAEIDSQIETLNNEMTVEDIDAQIAALDSNSATYADDLANLEGQRSGLRTDAEVEADIAALETEKSSLDQQIAQAQLTADDALSKLTKDRPLSDGGFQLFLTKLGL